MSERKAKLVWALPNEEEEKKRSFLTDENNENEWICHHISDYDLKSRKSKVVSLHYNKKKQPAKVELDI